MVYIFLGTGFEEVEAITPIDLLRRAGISVCTVGVTGKIVYGGHNIGVEADILIGEMDLTQLEMIVLPGGLGGVASIRGCQAAMDAIAFAHENRRFVAAICAGPTVLADLHITDGKQATCYPGFEDTMKGATYTAAKVTVDGNIFTACGPAAAWELGFTFVEHFCGTEKADELRQGMQFK